MVVMFLLFCCSDLSEDHTNDDSGALVQIGDEEESRSSDTSESDEEPSIRPTDHVGHPPLSLVMPQGLPAEKEALLLQFLVLQPDPNLRAVPGVLPHHPRAPSRLLLLMSLPSLHRGSKSGSRARRQSSPSASHRLFRPQVSQTQSPHLISQARLRRTSSHLA